MHGATRRARLAAIFLTLSAALGCAAAQAPTAAAPDGSGATGRVLVAPLNLALRTAPGLEQAMEPTYRALLQHLQRQDRPLAVLDARDALQLWSEVVSEATESEPHDALRAAASRFALRLAEEERFGVLVFPALLVRRALVRGYQVSWDGVRHPLPKQPFLVDEFRPAGGVVALDGLDGSIAAGSLHLVLLSADGALLHEGIGGLGVLQQVERVGNEGEQRWILTRHHDAFADAARLREGVERAFSQPLPRTARAW